MPIVYCNQRTWRRLRLWALPAGAPTNAESVLGAWCATITKDDGRELAVVVNVVSRLTLVFPLSEASEFTDSFRTALRTALEDLNVDRASIDAESQAALAIELKRATGTEFSEMLKYVEFFCGIELEYHTDLRRVQGNLNNLPHGDIDGCVPAAAVKHLFAQHRPIHKRLVH